MKTLKTEFASLAFACALLSGCAGEDPAVAAKAAAEQAAAQEAKAQEGAIAFDDAVKKENWSLAKAQADVLIAQYPDSAAAKRVRAEYDGIKRKLDETREAARTAALWSYGTQSFYCRDPASTAIYSHHDSLSLPGALPIYPASCVWSVWGSVRFYALEW